MLTRPSWLTVGALGLALTAGTYIATVSVKFGQQESDLAAQKAKNAENVAERDRLLNDIMELRKTYQSQQILLQAAQADVSRLQNDRCTPIYKQVYDLKDSINFPHRYGLDRSDIADLHIMLQDFQKTLQACYQAK